MDCGFKLTTAAALEQRALRAEFAGQPTKAELLAIGDYAGPMRLEEYFDLAARSVRRATLDQLRAAIAACGQSTHALA